MSGGTYDRWNAGAPLASFTPQERAELRARLVAHPAYSDAKSPHHKAYIDDARELYSLDFPDQAEPDTVFVNGRFVDLNAPRGGR